MKKGIILTNAYTRIKSAEYQSVRLKEEFELLGITIRCAQNIEFPCTVDSQGLTNNYSKYDFGVYLDKDKYIAKMLEQTGIRLFNRADSIAVCDDKMLTHIALAKNKIPMPKTLPGALCYTSEAEISDFSVETIIDRLGLPMIVKESYGSMGKGIYLAKNAEELKQTMNELKCRPHLFQEFIKESCGTDTRIIVIGGKYLCAMKRTNPNDFRSNIELGAIGSKITPNDEYIHLAEKAAKLLDLDYCGVDVISSKKGGMICEVNSNAFFGGMEKATGVNVAKAYAEYIINSI